MKKESCSSPDTNPLTNTQSTPQFVLQEMATLTPLTESEKQLQGNFVTSIDNDQLINQHFLHDNSTIKLFHPGSTPHSVANSINQNHVTNIS